MTTLHFGVNDIPYSDAAASMTAQQRRTLRWRTKKKPWQHLCGHISTGDVAEILERRYGIYQYFYQQRQEMIASAIEQAIQIKLENLMMGAPADQNQPLFSEGDLVAIEEQFRKDLDEMRFDGLPGVPTQAALKGINHRLKHPYARTNPPRPSFIDTGTYQANARVWAEE